MEWTSYPVEEYIKITEFFSFFNLHFDSNFNFKGETHNFWECMYVVEGELVCSADMRVYNMHKGDIIFHKPLELHKFYVSNKKGADIMVVTFSAQGALCDFFKNKVFTLNKEQRKIARDIIEYAEKNADNEKKRGGRYLTAFTKDGVYSQNVAVNIVRLMLSLAEESDVAPISQFYDSIIYNKAVKFLMEKVCENPTIEAVANHVNVSLSSVKRIFMKYAGMGIHKYLIKLKIKMAIELLQKGESVTDIAEKLAFSSQGYFTKTFKRETGMLPSEYKKKLSL